jgi:hypothetical protein
MRVRRSSTCSALTLGAIAATALVWSGCDAKKQTEYVAGVSTQVQVPRDLKAIRVDVSVGGVVQFCRGYRVYDGKVQLPRSLGEFPSQGKPGPDPITVTVSGFTEDFSETTGNSVFDNCTSVAPKVGDTTQGTRILRRSRQPYVTDSVLFLPMPLKYSCFDFKECEDESKTCKAGRCVDARTDESKLPKYTDDLVDGSGGTCFMASTCFAAAAPAVVVDADTCTYAVPNSPPSSPPQLEGIPPNPFPRSGDGVNVEITYDGGLTREVLDKDDAEGFLIPDPVGKPQQFRLTAGLCDMVKGRSSGGPGARPLDEETPHRITAVRVSGTCQAKSPFRPLCAADQLLSMGLDPNGVSANGSAPSGCQASEMRPPKAVLLVVADDTHNSDLFYTQAAQSALGLSLADPAFQKTELGLGFFPGPGTCATPGSFTDAVPPKLARLAKGDVVAQFQNLGANSGALLKTLGTPVNLDGALRDAYATLGSSTYDSYYRRAVFVLGNRDFDKATCGQTPAQRAAAAAVLPVHPVQTYVLMLARDIGNPNPDVSFVPPGSNELAVAGGTGHVYDARSNKGPAQDAFQQVVNDLATCTYDTSAGQTRPGDQSTLSYTNPIDPTAKTVAIKFNAACNTEAVAGEGFGPDPTNPNRAYLCKKTCDDYRDVLRTASLYAAQNGQSPIAVPVFAHKPGCTIADKAGGAGSPPTP